jgi:phosphoglycerate kinase
LSKIDSSISEVLDNSKIKVPSDVVVVKSDGMEEVKTPDKVLKEEFIIDAGPETIKNLKEIISKSRTVVWNGPLGKYKKGFKDATEDLAEVIADATSGLGVESIIGGGDTIAATNMAKLGHKFGFISTGGGAMLDYLVNETLPGIEALEN